MRFEVPQFIEIEDKIFGPFTWRQFLYLGGGVGMGVVLFITTPLFVFIIFGLPLAILAGALAFYPINSRPFSYFLESIVNYLRRNKLYLWKQRKEIIHQYNFAPTQIPKQSLSVPNPQANKKNLAALSRRLELETLQKNQ